jgi:hypothetical protein
MRWLSVEEGGMREKPLASNQALRHSAGDHAPKGMRRMTISRRFVLAAAFAFLTACGPAPGGDPVGTVQALYDPYLSNQNPKPFLDAAPLTSELHDMMKTAQEQASARGEPTVVVDFDPIIDGQDWELSDLNVELVEPAQAESAQVRARFKNMGEDVALTYDLVRQGGGWRIDNIEGANWTLRQLLADAGVSAKAE